MTAAEDTLYLDSHDEMSDYLDVLYEKDAGDGIRMAVGLMSTEPGESGQRPPGIWCLFGLEVLLSAAGVPSESMECWLIEEWAEGIGFKPHQALLEAMKAALAKVIAWRAEYGDNGGEVSDAEREAGEAMMRRIGSLAIGDGTYHEREGWAEREAAPAVVRQAPEAPEGPANGFESPPWWPELLERCRATVLSHPEVAREVRQAEARGWDIYPSSIPAWSPDRIAAPADSSATDWLIGEARRHDGENISLLQWFVTPSAFAMERMEAVSQWTVVEAYRTMLAALAVTGPGGLAKFLPYRADERMELINFQGSSIFGNAARGYADHLFLIWSGVDPRNQEAVPGTHPVEFWQETKGIWKPGAVITARCLQEHSLFVQAHWGAWLCGEWSGDAFRKPFGDGAYRTNGLPMIDRKFGCADARFPQFVADYQAAAKGLLDQLIREEKFEEAARTFRSYRGVSDMDLFLALAGHMARGGSSDVFGPLTQVDVLPSPDDFPVVRERLAALPQPVLMKLLTESGLALPLLLDALADRKFAETAKVILGTFSEPLMPDAGDFYRYGPHESTRRFHPGRAACGTTDFNPFFAAVAACPPKTFDEICRVFDGDGLVDVAYCRRPLKQIAGLPLGKIKGNPDSLMPAEWTAFFHRLPSEPEARAREVRARADGLARRFIPMMGNLDLSSRASHLRDLSYLHAEAAGFASWKSAALDLATQLRDGSELVVGDCRFSQTAVIDPGYAVVKGKRLLKNVPPAIAKSPELEPFLGRSQLLHGFSCLLRLTVIEEWVKTGELPEAGFCEAFKAIFGMDPGDWVRERDLPDPSAKLRPAIIELAGREKLGKSLIFDDTPIVPHEFLPRLRECGWPFYRDRGDDYLIERGIRGVAAFTFRLVTPRGERADTEKGLPKSPHLLALEQVRAGRESVRADECFDRAISVILHDIAITLRNLGE